MAESDEARERRLAFHRAYYAARREEMKAAQKARYEAQKGNPEFKAQKAAREKAWLEDPENRERKVSYRKAHHEANRDHDNAANQGWYAANREQRRQQILDYGAAHREEANERGRNWTAKNSKRKYDKQRAWALAHPDLVRSYWQRRRALENGAAGSFTAEDLRAQYEKQRGLCFYCERSLNKRFEIDHCIPLSRGGSNGAENIVLACRPCNRSKGCKHPEEFLASLWLSRRRS